MIALLSACASPELYSVPNIDADRGGWSLGAGLSVEVDLWAETDGLVRDGFIDRFDDVEADGQVLAIRRDPGSPLGIGAKVTGLAPGIGEIRLDGLSMRVAVEPIEHSVIDLAGEWFSEELAGEVGAVLAGTAIRMVQRHYPTPAAAISTLDARARFDAELIGELAWKLDAGESAARLADEAPFGGWMGLEAGDVAGPVVVAAGRAQRSIAVVDAGAIAGLRFVAFDELPDREPISIDALTGALEPRCPACRVSILVVPVDAAGRAIAGCPAEPVLGPVVVESGAIELAQSAYASSFCELRLADPASASGAGSVTLRYGDQSFELPVRL